MVAAHFEDGRAALGAGGGAGGEGDDAPSGDGDASSPAGTPGPVGKRVHTLVRHVSSLYKGRSVLLDEPVPDSFPKHDIDSCGHKMVGRGH